MISDLPQDPRDILVMALCPIGDTLFLTPALALLRRRFPQAAITAVVTVKNQGILRDNPDIDHVLTVTDPPALKAQQAFWAGVRTLGHLTPDLIINFSTGGSIMARLAGLRAPSLGLQYPPYFVAIGSAADPDYRDRHAVDHYFKVIEPLAPTPDDPAERVPRFRLTPESRTRARALLREAKIGPSDMIVTMHTGGDGFNGRKRWATERFATLASGLIARYNARIVLVGGPPDIPMSRAVAALVEGPVVDLSGKTTLVETGALIEASALFTGNDSSPLHIAAAVGTPSIGVYGPSDWREFSPVGGPGYRGRVLHAELSCSPCFHFVGNDSPLKVNTCYTFRCLKSIPAVDALAAAAELLAESGRSEPTPIPSATASE